MLHANFLSFFCVAVICIKIYKSSKKSQKKKINLNLLEIFEFSLIFEDFCTSLRNLLKCLRYLVTFYKRVGMFSKLHERFSVALAGFFFTLDIYAIERTVMVSYYFVSFGR